MAVPPRFLGPDEVALRRESLDSELLRRFALVRIVGALAYVAAAVMTFLAIGPGVWPLLVGAVVVVAVTAAFFTSSWKRPRALVWLSLLADTVALYGAIAVVGGTGAGLVGLYAIVLVSAGILLGTRATLVLTVLTAGLGLVQLAAEQLGFRPALLERPELDDRLGVLLVGLAGLISVGYLAANYADRLRDLIEAAGERAADARRLGDRRRRFVARLAADARPQLTALEDAAAALEAPGELDAGARTRLATELRQAAGRLDADVSQLADVAALDATAGRLEPVALAPVVREAVDALAGRLASHAVDIDVPPIKVLGHRLPVRRVVYTLLENVADHTPAGTAVRVRARVTPGSGVFAITDDGPGIPPVRLATLFDGDATVGLPLVRELCDQMDATIRAERPRSGRGARFLVAFRLAPRGAPSPDDAPLPAPATVPPAGPAPVPPVD